MTSMITQDKVNRFHINRKGFRMIDFRIIQITDLHIGGEEEYPFGVNLLANFLNTLAEVERMNPNLLVMTGDFCYKDPRRDVYEWIRPHVDALGIPYEIIGGNHDDVPMMTTGLLREDLSNEQSEYYFADEFAGHHILYLDSASGTISSEQLSWIEQEVHRAAGQDLMIFIHHPPVLAGVPHLDRAHALQNRQDLLDILVNHTSAVQVFCGHYHVDRSVVWKNVMVHITPSLFMQIFPYAEDFAIDHYQIGYRVIDFAEDTIRHSVRYLPGNRF